jgi:hypothetical protein
MKKIIFFTLLISSFGTFANSTSGIIKKLNTFHSHLAENRLLVRHELMRHITQFEKSNNRTNLKSYLKTLLTKSTTMNVSKDSKSMIKSMSQDLISNLDVAEVKVVVVKDTSSIIIPKLIENKIGEKVLSKKTEVVSSISAKDSISIPVEKNNPFLLLSVLVAMSAGLFAGLKYFARSRKVEHDVSKKNEGYLVQDALKGRRPLASLEELKTPVILIDDKEVIRWVNDKAHKWLGLSQGESFFLEHELKFDNEKCSLSYEQSGRTFDITVRHSETKKCKILTFIPLFEDAYSSISEVEGSLPITGIVSDAMMRNEYLFTNSGIPLIIDNRLSENFLADEKVNGVISKTLKLAYDMSKNIKGSRVDYILDEIEGSTFIQIDFKNQAVKNLKWENPINEEDFSLAEAWGELELSLADRQGRLFYYDDENVKGMSFQLMFEKTQMTVGSLA